MSYPFLKSGLHPSTNVQLPSGYRRTARWIPRIGDIFPNFCAGTTHGQIDFHSWAAGSWILLFSHPFVRGPISYTEFANFAMAADQFSGRNVKLLGMCGAQASDHRDWELEVEAMFNTRIDFPVVEDLTNELSEAFGMIHPNEGKDVAIRKTFIIDPQLKLRMLFEYPVFIGRSTEEILRVIDALQMKDAYNICTPADWQPGEEVLIPPAVSDNEAIRAHPEGVEFVTPHMRVVKKPPLSGH